MAVPVSDRYEPYVTTDPLKNTCAVEDEAPHTPVALLSTENVVAVAESTTAEAKLKAAGFTPAMVTTWPGVNEFVAV